MVKRAERIGLMVSSSRVRDRMDVYVSILGATVTMATMDCWSCGVIFAVPNGYVDNRRSDGATFYCPNGHGVSYGKSEADKLRERLEREERRRADAERWLGEVDAAHKAEQRAHAATKGKLTRATKRAEAGVCPHCSRSFVQMARHMRAKHQGLEAAVALADEMQAQGG